MLVVLERQVQLGDRADIRGDMQHLSCALLFWAGKQYTGELYLQQGLQRPKWAGLLWMCGRHFQGLERIVSVHLLSAEHVFG